MMKKKSFLQYFLTGSLLLFQNVWSFQPFPMQETNPYLDNLEMRSRKNNQNTRRSIKRRLVSPPPIPLNGTNGGLPSIIIPIQIQPREEDSNFDDGVNSENFGVQKKTEFNFSYIGGYDDVKKELYQMKDLLNDIDKYKNYNLRTPRGLLLEGPPGNGKTLLAKCFAGECNYCFISCSGSEFNEKYVGVGAARIRELFSKARKNQPCILFIDELDAIGSKRSYSAEGSSNERFQTLNQLLVLMDGFESSKDKIFIIGATNRKDILDTALLRSGRFDKIVHVPNPDEKTREEILKIHLYKKPIDNTISTKKLVDLTAGMSGAEIENMLNEASLRAIREDVLPVKLDLLENTRDKILLGYSLNEKKMSDDFLKRVAIHECGHLLVALAGKYHEKPSKITIQSTSPDSFGYTFFTIKDENKGLYLKKYLQEKIMTLLGGKIAEELLYAKESSSGVADDLKRCNDIATSMVTNFGMGETLVVSRESERQKENIDKQVSKIVSQMTSEVEHLLSRNSNLLQFCADYLLKRKTLNDEEILEMLEMGIQKFPSKDFSKALKLD